VINSIKQHNGYSAIEKYFIDYQASSNKDKNRNDENDNEFTLVAHEFHVNEEADYRYIIFN